METSLIEDQHQNLSLQSQEDHIQSSTLTGYDDPLLPFNGPNSCVSAFKDMVAPSPSLLTNNGPASNISTVPELEDFINSVPSLPSHTDTSANFTLLTPETSSVTSTQTISGTCDEVTEKFKGKGRKVNKKQWNDIKRKKNRNTGKSYVSRDGTKRPARKLNPMCHKCQFKCPGKFHDHIRTKIFENFWKLGNNVRQWDFISKYCKKNY